MPTCTASIPVFAGITQDENASNNNYNSLQAALRMENRARSDGAARLHVRALRSMSRPDDLNGASNPFNLRYDRASGGYDRRHNFEANYVYNIPFFMHADSFAERSVLGGWVFSGVNNL